MSFLSSLFGSPDTQKVLDNLRDETWVYDSTPGEIAMVVKAVPGMPPFRTCLTIATGGQVLPCEVEVERDKLKAQVDELVSTVFVCHELAELHKSKRNTGRTRNGAEACTQIASVTDFVINKYMVDDEENADADKQ